MQAADRELLEKQVRALSEGGDHDAAATLAIRGYGPELLGFLVAVHRDETEAGDAFSALVEVLWRKLPEFAWEASLRTWAYAIARNVSRTLKRDAGRRGRREPGAGESELEAVANGVRTQTLTYLRTAKRTRLQALRDILPEEDRMLLVLRVDRNLGWNDLARVLGEGRGEEPPSGPELAREAARLRKRFRNRERQAPGDREAGGPHRVTAPAPRFAFLRAGASHSSLAATISANRRGKTAMNARKNAFPFAFFALIAALGGCSHRAQVVAKVAQGQGPVGDFAWGAPAAASANPPAPRFGADEEPIVDAMHGWSHASPR